MSQSRSLRTQALVLKRRNFGEADRLLTLLTPQHGKRSAIAKGARKPASRKTGHVELFTLTEVLIVKGRNLDILTQAEMLKPYLPIRQDLTRGAYANYAAELLDRFTYDDDDDRRMLFTLLERTFDHLCVDDDPRRVMRFYEMRLLDIVGFRPELHECVVTRNDVQPEDQFFSYEEGGVVSQEGAAHSSGLVPLPMVTLKVLRHLQRSRYDEIATLTLSDALHSDLERVILGYISYVLESRLQSVAFIQRIRRLLR